MISSRSLNEGPPLVTDVQFLHAQGLVDLRNEKLERANEELHKRLISARRKVHDAAVEMETLKEMCHADRKDYNDLKDEFEEFLFNGAHERCKLFPLILQKREECSSSDYAFGKVIESQVGRSVVEAVRHWDGEQAVVKTWKKNRIRSFRQMNRIHDELMTLKKLQHRNIIPLMDIWETYEDLNIAYECFGKDLYYTLEHYNSKIPDSLIRQVTTPLIDALSYMHSHNIAHCDLKPENIMVRTNDNENILSVKLADFELAVEVGDDHALPKGLRGSKGFMAPEMFHDIAPYNPMKCDIWSLGCVLLVLLLHGEFEERWITHYSRVIGGNLHIDDFIEDLELELEIISNEIEDSSFHKLLMSALQISPILRSSTLKLVLHDQNARKATDGTIFPPIQMKKLNLGLDDGSDDDLCATDLVPHGQNVRKVIHGTRRPSTQMKGHRLRVRIDDSMPKDDSGTDDDILAQLDKKLASPGCISRVCIDFD